MNTDEIIATVSDLPVEERAKIADGILQTLNPVDPEIEKAWNKECDRRMKQVESGEVDMIPAEEFEAHINKYETSIPQSNLLNSPLDRG